MVFDASGADFRCSPSPLCALLTPLPYRTLLTMCPSVSFPVRDLRSVAIFGGLAASASSPSTAAVAAVPVSIDDEPLLQVHNRPAIVSVYVILQSTFSSLRRLASPPFTTFLLQAKPKKLQTVVWLSVRRTLWVHSLYPRRAGVFRMPWIFPHGCFNV